MERMKLLAIVFVAYISIGYAVAADTIIEQTLPSQQKSELIKDWLFDRVVNAPDNFSLNSGFDPQYLQKVNISCGYPPYPPYGCKLGACVCDQNGRNCHWTFECK